LLSVTGVLQALYVILTINHLTGPDIIELDITEITSLGVKYMRRKIVFCYV